MTILAVLFAALLGSGGVVDGSALGDRFFGWRRPDRALQEGQQNCTETLLPVLRKVALLFLVLDDIPHEALWRKWLDGIGGKLPARLLCNGEAMACFKALPPGGTDPVYDAQHFYTLYVHTKPEFPGYPEGHLFHNRIIRERVPTAWGDHSLSTALKLMITEALKDPFNQQFQLVCPATIPLRPALFTYTQLIEETRSRVGWYQPKEHTFEQWAWRFPVPMFEDMPTIEGHTRFHRQFITLARRHAQIISDDVEVFELFKKHCFRPHESHGSFCISDEQYSGTALSYYLGDAIASEVTGHLAMAQATSGGGFEEDEVISELLIQLRGSRKNLTLLPHFEDHHGECHAVERLNMTIAQIDNGWDVHQACEALAARGGQDEPTTLFPVCPLFARKFKERTVEKVQALLEKLMII